MDRRYFAFRGGQLRTKREVEHVHGITCSKK